MHSLTFKPLQLIKVTTPRVGTTEASAKTIRNRSNEVTLCRSRLTGGKGKNRQLLDEMKLLSQEEHDEL